MTDAVDIELESVILEVYRGPLEGFIKRRDALAKALRAEKRRDAADRVKALRKPSRTAWVLNSVVHEDAAAVEELAAAIIAAQTAQTGSEMRSGLEQVRNAVRAVAHAGARAGIRGGQPVEPNALMAAVHAVMGDASAFADLRAGHLVDVPEGGGLDILTAISSSAPAPPVIKAPSRPQSAAPIMEVAKPDTSAADAAAAARAELRRAEKALEAARTRLQDVERSVLNAQAKLDAAEDKVRAAMQDAAARRAELEKARQELQTAASRLREAESAVTTARALVAG